MPLDYGKEIVSSSYYEGKLTNKHTTYSIPIVVKDRSQVLDEITKALDLITLKKTSTVLLIVKADKNYQFKMIIKEYQIEQ